MIEFIRAFKTSTLILAAIAVCLTSCNAQQDQQNN